MKKKLNSSTKVGTVHRRTPRQPGSELKLRHILVPLDFSGQSRQALQSAIPLAQSFGAKICLMHVVQSPFVAQTFPDGNLAVPMDTRRLLDLARVRLHEMADKLLPAELRGRILVHEGGPAYEITTGAKGLKADLIVLSTHGFTGWKRALLGSTAERVVRHADCSVLTVRRRTGTPGKSGPGVRFPWRRILTPLDFSPTSLRALEVAVPLARECGARLELLNVVETAAFAAGMEGAILAVPERELTGAAKKNLAGIARRFVPSSIRLACRVTRGQAAEGIIQAAKARGDDLIVMSTHGHAGWNRLLLGSTAEQVVRRAEVPVFVVRPPRKRAGG